MPEPTIRVKLIPDTSGLLGGTSGVPSGLNPGSPSNQQEQKKAASMITIPITDILGGILKGIDRLAEASPILAASLKLLKTGVDLALMPIAEIFATLIRPMAMALLSFFGPLAAKAYEEGGGLSGWMKAFKSQISDDPGGAAEAGLVLTGLSLAPLLVGWGLSKFLKWLIGGMGLKGATVEAAAGGSALGLPIMLILAGGALGYLIDGLDGLIAGALGAVAGLVLASAAGVTGGVAAVITIGVALVAVGGWMVIKNLIKNIKNEMEDGGLLENFKLLGEFKEIYEAFVESSEILEKKEIKLPSISEGYDAWIKSKYAIDDVNEGLSLTIDAEGKLINIGYTKIDVLNDGTDAINNQITATEKNIQSMNKETSAMEKLVNLMERMNKYRSTGSGGGAGGSSGRSTGLVPGLGGLGGTSTIVNAGASVRGN